MYVLDHRQSTAEDGLLELHLEEGKSLEHCCVGTSGAVRTMGRDASVLEHSSLPRKHRPSARGDFVTAGQSLRLVIIRKAHFNGKVRTSHRLLSPPFAFP